jgi:predicted nucleic acid-binding protein
VIVYLDANIVIYVVERHPLWGPRVEARITQLRAGGDQVAVSDAHRLECLVGPLILNDPKTLADYLAFFSDPDIITAPITAPVWERAARIRAVHNLRPLDALHLAAAAEHGCGRFLTNDVRLIRFPDIPVEVLT